MGRADCQEAIPFDRVISASLRVGQAHGRREPCEISWKREPSCHGSRHRDLAQRMRCVGHSSSKRRSIHREGACFGVSAT
jgi:hypothetical protein